ncbi:Relaxase/mobilization nuclease domain protein (plasmid) [Phaeobacter piscinae]|uniref:Relaxase/mobilization nuclease domain protein n=1 Tax=Phaeobacter piscinae TaxID=1580596 RepID=A0ABM6PKQ7_9RHOB|nr:MULTISPECIES: relaxase/mobilization nuclease domain-containing protein [Phaeobacter]ATG38096.1 Relaxase/mobilization nuclease domain protein [Phaeobacter piscinae]AUQ88617.1 Relaxase/mobilization nuclease domain protein [Phaeobacter piscinae]AUQ92606.1 Relaxase/mobilization nuclease domain protein [Phaeobacter inhibens]AUR26422.1 Relaxase/mobilization nuclease domain protein [Phaeobacter piscinae]
MQNSALSLYHAIMGEAWLDENYRAGAARETAARRQGRSYKQSGRPSVRNVVRASKGSKSAVFKRIRNGGCKTRQSLGTQLSYVNDKAVFSFSTLTNTLSDSPTLTEGQKEKIVEQWAGTWRGTSKLGFTSHMLLSFPTDVSADQVRDISMDWCEHFFESGHYGDEWDYVLAVHTDRAHPHAHILLNNRGNDAGEWFSCWAGGVMSPQLMREKQAEIAASYGVALDATTRLERGIFAKPAGLEEVYAAKAEGRSAREIALSGDELEIAKAAVVGFAKEYNSIADLLGKAEKTQLASGVRKMAQVLGAGEEWVIDQGDIDLAQIETVGEAIEFAEARIDQIQAKAEGLTEPERSLYEVKAAPVIASLSQMVPDPELRVGYNETLANTYPPGVDGDDVALALTEGERSDELKDTLAFGEAIGLNVDDTLARIQAGGTKNHGLAQDWVYRDLTAILAAEEIDIEDASAAQIDGAVEKLDAFQLRLADELGVEMTSAFDVLEQSEQQFEAVRAADEAAMDEQREQQNIAAAEELGIGQADLAQEEGRGGESANSYISTLAHELRSGELTEEQEEVMERALVGELHKELGDEGMAELDRGNFTVLEDILPSKFDQIGVTQEYLELAAEERGLDELSETASALQQEKVTAQADEAALENARDDRGLDDDMGL